MNLTKSTLSQLNIVNNSSKLKKEFFIPIFGYFNNIEDVDAETFWKMLFDRAKNEGIADGKKYKIMEIKDVLNINYD